MNTYTLYKDNKLVKRNIKIDELTKITGIHKSNVTREIATDYKGFYFTLDERESSEILENIPSEIVREWNNMRKAADLLRNGGHIVTKRKKGKIIRYVVGKK